MAVPVAVPSMGKIDLLKKSFLFDRNHEEKTLLRNNYTKDVNMNMILQLLGLHDVKINQLFLWEDE